MSIQDFLKKADKLISLKLHDDKNYMVWDDKFSLNLDFTIIYDMLLSKINNISEHNLTKNIINTDKYLRLIRPVDGDDPFKERRLISKINNASNIIATEGRVGPGNVVLLNGNSDLNFIDMIQDSFKVVLNNKLLDGEMVVMRKISDEKTPRYCFDYYVDEEEDLVYYKFSEMDDIIYKNFVKIKSKNTEWNKFDNDNLDTLPPEGEEVLISDGTNYDVAYYVASGEYKWLKSHVEDDDSNDFTSFIPIKWKKIL